jgi:hypothetical protein
VTEPSLLPPNALTGIAVALSVSDSADLRRLGLTAKHCDLAVSELARAILLAGGTITYGGRLTPAGFTQVLLEEVERFTDGRHALTLCLAEPEHRKYSDTELAELPGRLGMSVRLVCLDSDGTPISPRERPSPTSLKEADTDEARAASYTALRHYLIEHSSARVLVGGQLRSTQGRIPGILEEALLASRAGQPLYVAGGYGGAAACVARALGHDDGTWTPAAYPAGADGFDDVLEEITRVVRDHQPVDGLTEGERRQLAVTHRPGDIASFVVRGLARRLGSDR